MSLFLSLILFVILFIWRANSSFSNCSISLIKWMILISEWQYWKALMKRFQRYFWKRELYVSAPLVVLNRLLPNQCLALFLVDAKLQISSLCQWNGDVNIYFEKLWEKQKHWKLISNLLHLMIKLCCTLVSTSNFCKGFRYSFY